MEKIEVDKTDLIEWLSICDSLLDLLTRYKVSSIFPFNLCYASLVALKSSIQDYKTQFENN